ncbi:MAG TPA: ABC transporter permease [Solirubrobacterales bacterium]|nr:ABC transporter permease [Solirubrobacterales bacterium]
MSVPRHTHMVALLATFAVVIATFTALSPVFLTVTNFSSIAEGAANVAIVAVVMTLVVSAGGIDLSVGSMLYLGGSVLAVGARSGWDPLPLFVAVILVTALAGTLNGVLAGYARLNALIVTIATFSLFRGVGEQLTEQQDIVVPPAYTAWGSDHLLGLPVPIAAAAAIVACGVYVSHRTVFARLLRAMGSNPLGAVESGISVRLLTLVAYMLVGIATGVAALITAGRVGAVDPTVGVGFELTTITAVVLGGTLLSGGTSSVVGSVLGALLLITVQNGLVLAGASPYWFDVFQAVVLILALSVSSLARGVMGHVSFRMGKPDGEGDSESHHTRDKAAPAA